MRRYIHSLGKITFVISACFLSSSLYADSLKERLQRLESISEIEHLESKDKLEKMVCKIEQQLDWRSEQAGNFTQRIIIKHRGFDKPTVMVTEGYGAAYALNPQYKEELSTLLDANLVFVEHRYFLESTPNPCNWDYLTVENSTGDYHHVRKLLGKIYPGKWFTTGISKGGQTTLFYRTFYPEDVDGSVAYVAPLNKSVEDGRHQPFLKNIKQKDACNAVTKFQREVLMRRRTIQPLFEAYCKKKGYIFRIPMNEVYDLMVLEYEFAFWQWGDDYHKIPSAEAHDSVLCKHLINACEPDYFSPASANTSFNVQAMRELGYYGYDTKNLKELLTIDRAEGYMRRAMIPDSLTYIEFDTNLYEKVCHFLDEKDCRIIFIYGENDPWTASGVTWLKKKDKKEMHVFIDPDGSHRARIRTLPQKTQKEIIDILRKWTK